MPLKEKSDSWIHEKWITHLPKDQNRIRNARNTCFKRWKYGSGNWGYTTDSHKHKTNSGHFMSLFKKKDGKYICIRDMGTSNTPLQIKAKERHLVWSVFPYYIPNEFIFSSKSNGMTPIDRTDFLT
jgi:hypothetical protein